jgi:hypothetical protein
MAVELLARNGRYGFRAYCDMCGKELLSGSGNVLTKRRPANGERVPIQLACKEMCTDRLDPKKQLANSEIDTLLLNLVVNCEVDIDEARSLAAMCDNLC